jgi:L-amino acid N-acyltransferase YncA
MRLRKATKRDIYEIEAIYVEGGLDESKLQFPDKPVEEITKDFEKHKKDRLKEFNHEINSKLDYFIIAEENGKAIGFGQAEINKEDLKKAWIEKVYVSRQYRKKGIGSLIIKELLSWLKKKKVKSISSGIFVNNKASIKLHEKFGFEVTAVRMQKKFMGS